MFGRKMQAESLDYTPAAPLLQGKDGSSSRDSNLKFLQHPGGRSVDLPQRPSKTPESQPKPPGGRTLTVGQDISLSGNISSCDTLVVQGTVEAKDFGGRFIDIAEAGTFKGSAEIETAKIAGKFDGDLTVRDHLHITATGRISGTIRYARLEVAPGGELAGDVGVLKAKA